MSKCRAPNIPNARSSCTTPQSNRAPGPRKPRRKNLCLAKILVEPYILCPYRVEVADTAVCTPDCARCQNRENTHTPIDKPSTVTLAHARRGLIIIIIMFYVIYIYTSSENEHVYVILAMILAQARNFLQCSNHHGHIRSTFRGVLGTAVSQAMQQWPLSLHFL